MQTLTTDLLVIGGGINGAGIAADAVGRGLSVILCEKDDLAAHTSSYSSKLIHGGLRYLEQYDFKLVREALKEREVLMNKAPYLIRPLRFVLPVNKKLRSPWLIRIGLFLYDHLAKLSQLEGSKKLKLPDDLAGSQLLDHYHSAFMYSDCHTDDARLVVTNALSAQSQGALILTRTECTAFQRSKQEWQVECFDKLQQNKFCIKAKAIVNATGAWVTDLLKTKAHVSTPAGLKLVKGSHFTVKKFYQGDHAYILQANDKRIVFVIPYLNDFALIGTTDVSFNSDPNKVEISQDEISYLLAVVNNYFKVKLKSTDINWTYSGVRALYDDQSDNPSKLTREYHLEVNDDQAPILSVFGGKITTFRTLSEHVLAELKPFFRKMRGPWTEQAFLPGGNLHGNTLQEFTHIINEKYPWLPEKTRARMIAAYGDRIHIVLDNAASTEDLGEHIGADLYEKEVRYWIDHEWAKSVDDMVWRRSKFGLYLNENDLKRLAHHLK